MLPYTWLKELQPCSSFFAVAFGEDRLCLEIASQYLGNAWVDFRAIISFAED